MANFFEQFNQPEAPAQNSAPYTGNKYESIVREEAQRQGVDPDLAAAVAAKESNFRPHVESGKGAIGLMQVMPATAKDMGYSPEELRKNPALQAQAGVQYLKQMLESTGNVPDALTAYHSGLGNLAKYQSGEKAMGPETAGYASDPKFSQWHGENISPFRQTAQGDQQPAEGQNFFSQFGQTQPQQDQQQESAVPQPLSVDQAMSQQPQPAPEAPPMSVTDVLAEAGRGTLQAGVNVANIPSTIADAAQSAAAWAAQKLGMGDGTYQPMYRAELPQNLQPQTQMGQIGAEVLPFLIPGVGPERAAATAARAAESGRAAQALNTVSSLAAESLPGALAQSSGQGELQNLPENLGLAMAGGAVGRAAVGGITKGVQAIDRGITARAAADSTAPVSANMQQVAGKVSRAAESPSYTVEGRMADAAKDVQPRQEVIDAAKRMGIDEDELLLSHVSGNQSYRDFEQALKSVPASQLSAQENAVISKVAKEAGEISDTAGALPDKIAMTNRFENKFNGAINKIGAKEGSLYDKVRAQIPTRAAVDPRKTVNMLEDAADDVGGMQHLSTMEKKVYNALSPDGGDAPLPTYALLDNVRKDVGQALFKKSGPYADEAEYKLSKLYAALTEDQGVVAKEFGADSTWNAAKKLTVVRKNMEQSMVKMLGKELNGDVVQKASLAVRGLAKGDAQGFRALREAIPSDRIRREVIATSMKDAFSLGSRKENEFHLPGFVDWYQGMKSSGTLPMLEKELGKQTAERMRNLFTLSQAIRTAQSSSISTGRLSTFIKQFDKSGGALDSIYRRGKTALAATILGHIPLAGPAVAAEYAARQAIKSSANGARSAAADNLLASGAFKEVVRKQAAGQPPAGGDRIIAQSDAWKDFFKTLTKAEKEKVARLGIIGWMSGERDDKE
jgi:hypothetical protein